MKGIVLDKILNMTNTINDLHQQVDLFKDDEKIEELIEEENKIY